MGAERAAPDHVHRMGTLLLVAIAVVAAAFVLDVLQRAIGDGRAAARDALRQRHDAQLIDDEAFARGLSAIDEAA